MFRVYLAGPISGLDHGEASGWRDNFERLVGVLPIQCLSPMRSKEKLIGKGIIDKSYEEYGCLYSARGIMSRDFNDCTTSNLVVFNMLGTTRVSIGTVMELAWAFQARIPSVVIMEDGNLHEHPMFNEATNFRVGSVEEAAEVTRIVLGL